MLNQLTEHLPGSFTQQDCIEALSSHTLGVSRVALEERLKKDEKICKDYWLIYNSVDYPRATLPAFPLSITYIPYNGISLHPSTPPVGSKHIFTIEELFMESRTGKIEIITNKGLVSPFEKNIFTPDLNKRELDRRLGSFFESYRLIPDTLSSEEQLRETRWDQSERLRWIPEIEDPPLNRLFSFNNFCLQILGETNYNILREYFKEGNR